MGFSLTGIGSLSSQDQRALGDALLWASENGSVDIVELLLQLGLDLHAQSADGDGSVGGQALRVAAHRWPAGNCHCACMHANTRGSNPASRRTSMRVAFDSGSAPSKHLRNLRDVTVALLAGRADADSASANGFTALAVACQYGAAEVVRDLLAHRTDVNVQALNGRTPLMLAATFGHAEIVMHLLKHQATVPLSCSMCLKICRLSGASGFCCASGEEHEGRGPEQFAPPRCAVRI